MNADTKCRLFFHCSSAGWKVYGSYIISQNDAVKMGLVLNHCCRRRRWLDWAQLDFVNWHNGYFNCSYGGGPPRFGGNRGGGGGKFGNPGDRLRKKQWNLDELPKFEKNFYQQHPDVARRNPVCSQHGPWNVMQQLQEMCSLLHVLQLCNRLWPLNLLYVFLSCSKKLNSTEGPKPSHSRGESAQILLQSFMRPASHVSVNVM